MVKYHIVKTRYPYTGIQMRYKEKEDKLITTITVFATFALFILWCFRDSPELFDGGTELYDYAINLFIGVIVAYIFFYLNVLVPKKRQLRHTLKYVGECIGTICFNEISKVKSFEIDAKNIKIMNIMGVKIQHHDVTPTNRTSIQEDANIQNIHILTNLLDVVEKNAFHLRTNIVEVLNALFPLISEKYIMTQCNIPTEHQKMSFTKTLRCKRYSGRDNIGTITRTAIDRLDYLLDNESTMQSINTAIQFGTDKQAT